MAAVKLNEKITADIQILVTNLMDLKKTIEVMSYLF